MEALHLDGLANRIRMHAQLAGNRADLPMLGVKVAANLGAGFRCDHRRRSSPGSGDAGKRIHPATAPSADNAAQERSAAGCNAYLTGTGCRKGDRNGTLIRHARWFPVAVLPLPVAMVEPSFRAALVTAVGSPPLLEPRRSATFSAAIAMSAIAVLTDPKHCPAPNTNPLSQNHAMGRHLPSADGLDNGDRSCQRRPCR